MITNWNDRGIDEPMDQWTEGFFAFSDSQCHKTCFHKKLRFFDKLTIKNIQNKLPHKTKRTNDRRQTHTWKLRFRIPCSILKLCKATDSKSLQSFRATTKEIFQ